MQAWGRLSISAQDRGLEKLGDMATPFFGREGMLFTRDVGPVLAEGFTAMNTRAQLGTFLAAKSRGSYRMGTLLNDIQPRNMGANGLVFDPAVDPLLRGMVYGAVPAGIGIGGAASSFLSFGEYRR